MSRGIAYFCMEYGVDSALDTYAGGLGILAGDVLKAAYERGDDLIGIGLLWTEGYLEQVIEDSYPVDKFQHHNYEFLEDIGISYSVKINGEDVKCKVYRTDDFENNSLYLIDTSVQENSDKLQELTSKLYPEDRKTKVLQQLLLGKAGVELLSRIDFEADILHLNEADSAFAAVEFLRRRLEKGKSFEEAVEKTKEKVRFTTHTPVKAGNPTYSYEFLGDNSVFDDIPDEKLKTLGGNPLNLTLLGLRLAGKANAVSKRHKKTAEEMWSDYGKIPEILALTNGVHLKTWQSKKIRDAKSTKELWKMHQLEKERLLESMDPDLNPQKLLIGFAKRLPEYKRATLFFRDEERAGEILDDVNIVFSGKAHPANHRGKEAISQLVNYSEKFDSVSWIEDYEMDDAVKLVKGCDVWLSCPVPPKEACSTSVMKAASNGVLNLSVLDGWWWEACEHGKNGWQYGDGEIKDGREDQDRHDASALYEVLEREVIPTYYTDRDRWKEMMKKAIETVKEKYSTKKMLGRYHKNLW